MRIRSFLPLMCGAAVFCASPASGAGVRGRAVNPVQTGMTEAQKAAQERFVIQMLRTPLKKVSSSQAKRFVYRVTPGYLPENLQKLYFRQRKRMMDRGMHRSAGHAKELSNYLKRKKRRKRKVDPNSAKSLLAAGYEELEKPEVRWLSKQTKCSEAELIENSTLKKVMEPGRKKKTVYRYFMWPKDPLFGPVANYRKGHKKIGGTRFFGSKRHSYCGGKGR